ncbi:MAG: type I restriction enzyme HsdR N-terminal domain-containing protein [Bacteroidaceae bacterium]|nr:type I restriction enzyme HsdR N-terminal domain-containing protein [Bacteroidaceae bacterium]
MTALNLPNLPMRLRKNDDGKIDVFDPLRQKFVALTPEEQVRQAFVNYLIHLKQYPQSLMANEVSLSLNGMQRRCDTVLYDIHIRPRMIIEYKRPTVKITQKVFSQICRYNIVMRVDYLIVSNGLQHYCCKMDYENQTYTFLKEIPDYGELEN